MKSAVLAARICSLHSHRSPSGQAPILIRPVFQRLFSVSTRSWNEKQRAEAATALLRKCDIDLPTRNTFDLHAKSNHQLSTERESEANNDNGINNNVVNGTEKTMYMDPNVIDPFKLMEPQLRAMKDSVKLLVTADNPVLQKVSSYFFESPGKLFRPALILLMAQATPPAGTVNERQRRLAEITEMIHTASLMHDDVMDHADTRRGVASLNSAHGNRLAILAGDFLLSRASLNLARLQNTEVVELLSTVIAHLVEGEVMQASVSAENALNFDYYMRKTYLKTASLLAHSCKAAVLLGGDADTPACRLAADCSFSYGKHLGLAFQLQDDVLDFVGDPKELGKPAGSDLRAGLTTAPVLYALEERPELRAMVERGFSGDGDAERALDLVKRSAGVARCRALAREHASLAAAAARDGLPPSPASQALEGLAAMVVDRCA